MADSLTSENQSYEHDRAYQRDRSKYRMDEENQQQKERKPGQIEKRCDGLALQDCAHAAQIVEWSNFRAFASWREAENVAKETLPISVLEEVTDTAKQLPAQGVKHPHHDQQSTKDQAQQAKGRHARAREDTVIDLEHE